MARSLNGSTQYASVSSWSLGGSGDVTMSIWAWATSWNQTGVLFDHQPSFGDWDFFFENPPANLTLSGGNNSSLVKYASSNLSGSTWYHLAATIVGTTGTIYVNGAQAATGTVVATTGSTNTLNVGRYNNFYYFTGQLAEPAVWNVGLSANEMLALGTGKAVPWRIRPASLTGYWPLFGLQSPEPDLSGKGKSLTLTGSPPQANHAPVKLFTPRRITQPILPAPGGGLFMPCPMSGLGAGGPFFANPIS
jgi:hypothetical protein